MLLNFDLLILSQGSHLLYDINQLVNTIVQHTRYKVGEGRREKEIREMEALVR